jgi:hypothetical protein
MRLVTENNLDEWSRSTRVEAQAVVVELVSRLIRQTVPDASRRRIPLGDSLNQPGADVVLETSDATGPFVPRGLSFWEIGTGGRAGDKATRDYRELTRALSEAERHESTFVVVTPLSGVREHVDTWSPEQQKRWVAKRMQRGDWADVRVIDGTQLVDWLGEYPVIEEWLARTIGIVGGDFESAEARWTSLRSISSPPLKPDLFLKGRGAAVDLVDQAVGFEKQMVQLDTRYPRQVADFVAARVEALDGDARQDVRDRTAILGDVPALVAFADRDARHLLVIDFDTSLVADSLRGPLERASQKGHAIVVAGAPGGKPSEDRAVLAEPGRHGLEEALAGCGFDPERARVLAQQSDGNISALIRSLRRLPLAPGWATGDRASDLAVAQLAGAWDESTKGDLDSVAALVGGDMDAWVASLRNLLNRPETPLRHVGARWRVSPRFSAWELLGVHLFDSHLDKFRDAAQKVLAEVDPKFDLPKDERFMAAVKGKVLAHSPGLRGGMADTLALLGNESAALLNCSVGKAAGIALSVVGDVLSSDDWRLWAGLGELLPLLAEAAPDTFLDAVEAALRSPRTPFAELFAQEGDGITGWNHMSGILWALETLAWEPRWLPRVLVILGRLAEIDPGGQWSNRPDRSMANILLPWHRQTTATVEQRAAALKTVAAEHPHAAWRVLQLILPDPHQMTMGSRKPAWRRTIPDDWTPSVTTAEYIDEVQTLLGVAIGLASESIDRMVELVKKLDDVPGEYRAQILEVFSSADVLGRPEDERAELWRGLDELVRHHRRFAHADWALDAVEVDAIDAVAELLAPASPSLRYRPLFSDRHFDLVDTEGEFEAQFARLEERRRDAVKEVLAVEGLRGVEAMATQADAPWRVGYSLGSISEASEDSALLPRILGDTSSPVRQFASGYARGRLDSSGWPWVESLDMSSWGDEQIACLLGLLPLCREAWERAASLLSDDGCYWKVAGSNPFEVDADWDFAASKLTENGRAWMAVEVFGAALHREQQIDSVVAVRSLKCAVACTPLLGHDIYSALQLIQALQADSSVSEEDLAAVEWVYLTALDESQGDARPLTLHRLLATRPEFFCDVLHLGFRPEGESSDNRPPLSETEARMATNAWRLLDGWRRVPGMRDDGTVDGDALDAWWSGVLAGCAESGYAGIAEDRLGHVLAFAPPDSDGFWINRHVADFLNRQGMDDLRTGFSVGRYNARGMHNVTWGRAELEIAGEYDAQSDALRGEGLHRLAETVSGLADGYRRDAAREACREDRD